MRYLSLFLLLTVLLVSCRQPDSSQTDASSQSQLGQLEHQFTLSAEASPAFNKGLLLLHSFEYDDAREAFQEAIAADSLEIMAYWGAAMTHYAAFWGLQDVAAGRKVMQALGDTREARLAQIKDPLEQDFWQGVEILFGEGEFLDRNKAYADYMAALYKKHPDNQEVAAFYALGLMWSTKGREASTYDRSARVAAGILEENPLHPGALHYMIHAYDDPAYAELAQNAANQYSTVAPDATHALHMPSHIYLALGMWDEVVSSNEVSYQASVNRLQRKGLGNEARGYHSYAWLHYGYLQQGRYQDAHRLLKDMVSYTRSAATPAARSYLIMMQNAYLSETGSWSPDLEPLVVDRKDIGLISQAGHRFFQGHLAFQHKEATKLAQQIDSLQQDIDVAAALVTSDGIALCSAGPTRFAPDKNALLSAEVMLQQLQALQSLLASEDSQAEKHLQQAVKLESQTLYSFGPPDIALPSFEQYGEWLLEHQRPEEALAQFNKSLERAPLRTKALAGKLKALEAMEQTDEAKQVQKQLEAIRHKADQAS